MAKFKTEIEVEGGWSRWVPPMMQGYRMACCDCGLVHDMEYQIVKVKKHLPDGTWEHGNPLDPQKYRVMFRAKRNNRSTARLRKRKVCKVCNGTGRDAPHTDRWCDACAGEGHIIPNAKGEGPLEAKKDL